MALFGVLYLEIELGFWKKRFIPSSKEEELVNVQVLFANKEQLFI